MAQDSPGAGRRPRRRPTAQSVAVLVEEMGPPISSVLWSPNVVAQSLEILAVTLQDGKLFWLRPVHALSLRVGLPRSAKPTDFILDAMTWYPLVPRVVHSTSWRYEEDRVVLTYVVVVELPASLPPGSLEVAEVERAELARGKSMAPPDSISIAAVLEHALRHLSWLIRDDPAIATSLASWSGVLADYQPEPFRALG